MARLIRRVPCRHVVPRCPCSQYPEDAVEHLTERTRWTSSSAAASLRLGQELFNDFPLRIGELHCSGRSSASRAVDPRRKVIEFQQLVALPIFEMCSSRAGGWPRRRGLFRLSRPRWFRALLSWDADDDLLSQCDRREFLHDFHERPLRHREVKGREKKGSCRGTWIAVA